MGVVISGAYQWFIARVDALSQFLTSAPLWLQSPVVLMIVLPLCGVLALIWLRCVDACGTWITRAFSLVARRLGLKTGLKTKVRAPHLDQSQD
ncbi:hypothetical protein [Corynebacterium sp. sy039]|uniref:hypothetical protein n=1 Tax=Corynebacterium sp. sy039 TaxID=2599641 RepID=UPI0011B5C23B|nr:hypothetical protein [Corynebacterium sp. sy039]QDZ43024.1 hypothetical protein FQV43_07510 [Corynebacterium sp. sy039]